MSATLWDSFDNLLQLAEREFLNFNFDKAIEHWTNYYNITAKKEYKRIVEELEKSWDKNNYENISNLGRLFQSLQDQRTRYIRKEISSFTYQLYRKLLVKIYRERFQSSVRDEVSAEVGIFEYLSGNYADSVETLKSVISTDSESIISRVYLGYAHMAQKDQRSAIAILSQNLILAADQLREDELYLSQFKLLYGKLYSQHGNLEEAAWLLAYESWYRNWLIFDDDHRFFSIIQNIETNERIMQVKYYSYERIRHFVRCLFISEYVRQYLKKEKGIVEEQEHYMQKLDAQLFDRYRKKRKGTKTEEEPEK